jgi:hypothetical protein
MMMNVRHLGVLVWGLANAGLIAGIATELGPAGRRAVILPQPPVIKPAPVEFVVYPDFHLPPREKAFAVTLERPLFVPDRRKAPPIPPPPPPPPPTMKKGQFQLVGTIITDDGKAAYLREIAGGKVRQVQEGAIINGILLQQVDPDHVVLTQYDDREELILKIQPSPAKAPPAPAPGQASPAPVPARAPATFRRMPGQPLQPQ